MKAIKENVIKMRDLFDHQRAVLVFILLLSVSQLLYEYIPMAFYLNIMLVAASIHMYNFRSSGKKMEVLIGPVALLAGIYLILIFANNAFIVECGRSLIKLWISLEIIGYFFLTEDFREEFLQRLSRFFLALFYFLVMYGIIYLIVFLINQVFMLEIPYDGLIFRIANAVADFVGLAILFTYEKEEIAFSNLFVLMFRDILPKLSIVSGGFLLSL
ncbi:MAG: hypothetical protein GX219_08285 [Tissierellia bacterium]|nr:hypothetical protein [Tissierellia bacterium]NLM06903.1 hypothetical protein [Tissierellia bacterium]